LEEEGQWGDHEIDGRMPYRGMQPTCSGIGTGRLQQEMRSGGRRLGRPWSENGPERHRRRIKSLIYQFVNLIIHRIFLTFHIWKQF
jgi:hypothetical protein